MQTTKLVSWGLFGGVLLLVALVFAQFFQQIPTDGNTLAMDWKGPIWTGLRDGLPYEELGVLVNPPWSVLVLLPLGQMPMQAAWGILTLISLLILIISVPRTQSRFIYWASAILLAMSFPSIRNLVDGNLEALMVLGIVLVVHGYRHDKAWALAIGGLFTTTKPQTTLLLVVALGLYLLQSKPPRLWLTALAIALVVIVPTMIWRGPQWLNLMFAIQEQGSIMDISLLAALRRTAMFDPAINWLIWGSVLVITSVVTWTSQRTFTREKAGYLIAASLLLAPYAASTLTLLAVGVIPLFQKRRWLGGFLIAFAYGQFFLNRPAYIPVFAYYSTAFLLLSWGALLWHVWQTENRTKPEPIMAPALS